jgi:hypothetical protein
MNWHVEWELARQKLAEARAWAKVEASLRSVQVERQPVRVWLGLGLMKLGRWLAYAGQEPDRVARRVAA